MNKNKIGITLISSIRTTKPRVTLKSEHEQNPEQSNINCLINYKQRPNCMSQMSYAKSFCGCKKSVDNFCLKLQQCLNNHFDWRRNPGFKLNYLQYEKTNFAKHKYLKFRSQNNLYPAICKKFDVIIKNLSLTQKLVPQSLQCLIKTYGTFVKYMIQINNIFVWLSIGMLAYILGVYYHVSPLNQINPILRETKQAMIFWMLILLANKLGNTKQSQLNIHCDRILILINEYFPEKRVFFEKNGIILKPIIMQWLRQLMCGYMDVENLGFYILSIYKHGWNYVYKIILSYLEIRYNHITSNQIVKKNDIYESLIDSSEQWPLVFCNAVTFQFDK